MRGCGAADLVLEKEKVLDASQQRQRIRQSATQPLPVEREAVNWP